MKIEYHKYPEITEISIPSDINKLHEAIKDGMVELWVTDQGRTAIDLSIGRGSNQFRFNQISSDKLLYKVKRENNWLSGYTSEQHYLKLTKKQGIESFESHIKSLLYSKYPDIDTVHVYISNKVIHPEFLAKIYSNNQIIEKVSSNISY